MGGPPFHRQPSRAAIAAVTDSTDGTIPALASGVSGSNMLGACLQSMGTSSSRAVIAPQHAFHCLKVHKAWAIGVLGRLPRCPGSCPGLVWRIEYRIKLVSAFYREPARRSILRPVVTVLDFAPIWPQNYYRNKIHAVLQIAV
jgi:hypothetical protein